MTKKEVAKILDLIQLMTLFFQKIGGTYLLKKNKINELSPTISYHLCDFSNSS